MKSKKIIAPLLLASVPAAVYLLARGKRYGLPEHSKELNRETARKAAGATRRFGNITKEEIDTIVKNTYRGVKAVINGDTLEYYFKSGSGKKVLQAKYEVDESGNLINTFASYIDAKSPQFFAEHLMRLMESKKKTKE